MSTLLQINSSIFSEQGQSSRLAQRFANAWRARNPGGQVVQRDLTRHPVPHLTLERFQAFGTAPAERTPEQQQVVAESDALIAELKAADVLTLGLPMYNFTVPTHFKAWFDHIARAGETFRYTEQGPEGLLAARKLVVFATSGGRYLGTPAETTTALITTLFNFIGISDIEFVRAEGLAMAEAQQRESLDLALERIQRLAA